MGLMIQKAQGRDAYLGYHHAEELQADLPANPGYEWVYLDEIPADWTRETPKSLADQLDAYYLAQPKAIQDAFAAEWAICTVLLQYGRFTQARHEIQRKQIPADLAEQAEALEAFRAALLAYLPAEA